MVPWHGDLSGISAGDLDAFLSIWPTNRLLLNGGTGSFVDAPTQPPTVTTAGTPSALGDLDGDGDLDVLATATTLTQPIPLWLNQGTGTFTLPAGQVAAPPYLPRQIAVGDLDGDGDLDALVANGGPETLLLNNGAANFSDASALVPPATDDSASVALGDLDGDGDLDALVGNGPCTSPVSPDRVLLNNGIGTFSNASAPLPPPANSGDTRSLSLGDVDGDGDLDAVLGNVSCSFPVPVNSSATSIFWNNGAASFVSTTLGPAEGVTTTVSAADADADGDLDVFVHGASDCSTESLCTYGHGVLYRNMGGSAFLTAVNFTGTSGFGGGMVVWDVDVLAGRIGGQTRLYLNDGAGGFADVSGAAPDDSTFPSSPVPGTGLGVGDLDGDGDLDALTTHSDYFVPNFVRLYRNDGTGLFANTPVESLPFFALSTAIALGDLDGDADLDVLIGRGFSCTADSPLLLLNTGAGAFLSGTFPSGTFVSGDVALGDVDGDGDLDALFGTSGNGLVGSCAPLPDRLYLNNGSASFTAAAGNLPAFIDMTNAVALSDFDGDGDLDAFLANNGQASRLYENDGAGLFSDATSQVPAGSPYANDLGARDVDGDGDVDLLLGIGGPTGLDPDLLYLNDGTGTLSDASAQLAQAPGPTSTLALGDAEGDGDLDAYVGGFGPDRLLVNDGSGAFVDSSAGIPLGGGLSSEVTWGDADSDGDSDVLFLDGGGVPHLRVLSNLSRQLTRGAVPRVGKPLALDLYGPPFGSWFLGASPGTGNLPLPPLGTLRLDPAVLIFLLGGLLDGQGRAAATFPVPAIPALVGGTIYWQALVVGPARLTNLESTTFTNL
ncbi:MAG: VCBS repeat-containing protein [Planctomycetes bacterium]|nr:VCBS repeat-containing protein [Planctomycetota bacterium]